MVRLSRAMGRCSIPLWTARATSVRCTPGIWPGRQAGTPRSLDAICGELFRDIDQDTVDFVDNYDGKLKEPALLPTTFPNVLVSANQGIAVGMASNLCGFNLGEVCDTTIAFLKTRTTTSFHPEGPGSSTGGELLYDAAALARSTALGGAPLRCGPSGAISKART